jgi:hypothetical protein
MFVELKSNRGYRQPIQAYKGAYHSQALQKTGIRDKMDLTYIRACRIATESLGIALGGTSQTSMF